MSNWCNNSVVQIWSSEFFRWQGYRLYILTWIYQLLGTCRIPKHYGNVSKPVLNPWRGNCLHVYGGLFYSSLGASTYFHILTVSGHSSFHSNDHLDGWPLWSPCPPHGLGCRTIPFLHPYGCSPFHRIPSGCIWSYCDDIPIPNLLRNRLPPYCTYEMLIGQRWLLTGIPPAMVIPGWNFNNSDSSERFSRVRIFELDVHLYHSGNNTHRYDNVMLPSSTPQKLKCDRHR